MKRVLTVVVCLLLLSGCTRDSAMDQVMKLRGNLLNAAGCEFDAFVTADYGDITYTFGIHCKSDDQGNITFLVTQPESICGISGRIDHDGGKLTFDDAVLGFEILADGLMTPVSSPWFFLTALRSGYMKACEQTRDGIRLIANDTYRDNAFQVDIYIDDNMQPIHSDIFWKGYRIITISVSNFSIL